MYLCTILVIRVKTNTKAQVSSMNTRKILSIAAIAILLVTSTIVLAQEGHLRVKNCSTVTIYVATADWIDPLGWIPYKHNAKHLKPQQTHYFYFHFLANCCCSFIWHKDS